MSLSSNLSMNPSSKSASVVSGCCCLPFVVFVVLRVVVFVNPVLADPPSFPRDDVLQARDFLSNAPPLRQRRIRLHRRRRDPLDVATIDRTTARRCSLGSGSP